MPDQTATKAQLADAVFGALASPQRRAVLHMLAEAEREAAESLLRRAG